MPATRIVRRTPRPPPQLALPLRARTQLDLAVSNNYLNNIEPDDVIRHLRAGSDDQYRAAQFLESALEANRETLGREHEEAISQLDAESDACLRAIETALTDALHEVEYGRVTPDGLVTLVGDIARRVAIMHEHDCDYDDAELYMPEPVPAPVAPPKRGSVKAARRA